jgi:hypothetical protein
MEGWICYLTTLLIAYVILFRRLIDASLQGIAGMILTDQNRSTGERSLPHCRNFQPQISPALARIEPGRPQ